MSQDTIDQTIDFIINHSTPEFKIGFSGGETLLAFDALNYFIEQVFKAKKYYNKKVYIEVATNGVLMDHQVLEFLIHHRINLVFSLDGDRETTNRNRRTMKGNGVYDDILRSVDLYRKILSELNNPYHRIKAECTIDSRANLLGSVGHLFDLGFNDVLARPAVVSKYTGFENNASSDQFLESFQMLVIQILAPLEISDLLLGNYDHMLVNILKPLLYMIKKKTTGYACEIFKNKICITADGNLVPCFLLYRTPNDELVAGNVFAGVYPSKIQSIIENVHSLKSKCHDCWASSICSQCVVFLKEMNSDITPFGEHEYCKLTKQTLAILENDIYHRYSIRCGLEDERFI